MARTETDGPLEANLLSGPPTKGPKTVQNRTSSGQK